MKLKIQIVAAAVVVAAGAGWYFKDRLPFWGAAPAQVASPAPGANVSALPVEVAEVKTQTIAQVVDAVGTAHANEAMEVTAKANGVVSRIGFQEGQKVTAGTTLIELDAGENRAKLAEMRAARDNIRQQLERGRQLLETRAIAAARVDDLQKQLEVAEARIRGEEAKYGDTVLRAPFSGKVGMRLMSPGSLVKPGDMITTLDDISSIKLEFEVPETYLVAVQPGLKVTAASVAYPGRKFEGTVNLIDTRIDPVTRSTKVRAVIPNPEEMLRPGMFLTVQLQVGRKENAVVVPEEALLAFAGQQYVFIVRDGKAYQTKVNIGQRQNGVVEITEGLQPGLTIITGGLQKVRNGLAVMPLPQTQGKSPVEPTAGPGNGAKRAG